MSNQFEIGLVSDYNSRAHKIVGPFAGIAEALLEANKRQKEEQNGLFWIWAPVGEMQMKSPLDCDNVELPLSSRPECDRGMECDQA